MQKNKRRVYYDISPIMYRLISRTKLVSALDFRDTQCQLVGILGGF